MIPSTSIEDLELHTLLLLQVLQDCPLAWAQDVLEGPADDVQVCFTIGVLEEEDFCLLTWNAEQEHCPSVHPSRFIV